MLSPVTLPHPISLQDFSIFLVIDIFSPISQHTGFINSNDISSPFAPANAVTFAPTAVEPTFSSKISCFLSHSHAQGSHFLVSV